MSHPLAPTKSAATSSAIDLTRQTWFDPREFPFTSRFFTTAAGKIHYLDEGSGPALVFVHGTPSWSYEFRHLIAAFAPTHRCIALDHLGFGLSDRPVDFTYRLAEHSANLQQLLAHLQLSRYSLVVHDFGGPIALPLAVQAPQQIDRLVVMNSWAWPMDVDPKFRRHKRWVDSWLLKQLYLRCNFSARFLVKASWGQHRPLSVAQHQRFQAMFPTAQSRLGTWAFARALVREGEYFTALDQQITGLRDVPTAIIWGMADPMVGAPHLARWREKLPGATFIELENVGHFPQEEAPQALLQAMAALQPSFFTDRPATR